MAGERVAKDVAKVVPDLGTVQVVCKVDLRCTGPQPVVGNGNFERLAARVGVSDEGLAIAATVGTETVRTVDIGTDGPQGYGEVALVDDLGRADGAGTGGGSQGNGGDSQKVGKHCDLVVYLRWKRCGLSVCLEGVVVVVVGPEVDKFPKRTWFLSILLYLDVPAGGQQAAYPFIANDRQSGRPAAKIRCHGVSLELAADV